jgi:hypothetical protein
VGLQVTCGTELGVLLIDTYNTAKVPCDTISIGKYKLSERALSKVAGGEALLVVV